MAQDDYFSAGAKMAQADQNRDKSRRQAVYRSVEGTNAFTPPRDYMKMVGREGLDRQQEAARDQADAEDARIQRRQTPTRTPTKRTPTKRTPPRTAGRK